MNTTITVNTQVLPLSVLGQGPKGEKGDTGEAGASVVDSVNGKIGAVVLTHLDVGAEAAGVAQAAAAAYTNNAVALEVTARNAAISVERNRAIGAESALSVSIGSTNLDLNAEIARATAAEGAETSRAVGQEVLLGVSIANEIARASNAESILAADLVTAQNDADQALMDAAAALDRTNHTGVQAATTITQDSTHRFATDAEKTAWNAAENNAKTYADGLVVGLIDDRGGYDASTNAFPGTGGSGPANTIMKGDLWIISVAGTLPGSQPVTSGDTIRALEDGPLQDPAKWAVLETNIGYVPAPSSHVGSGGAAHSNATISVDGFMSATDKTKLDGITGTNTGDQTITLTGDVTGSGTGSFATAIGANKVTDAMLVQVASAIFKGRSTAGVGNVEDLTPSQATALLNLFVGGAAGTKGLVPTSTTQNVTDKSVLMADGTWVYPGKIIQTITHNIAPSSGTNAVNPLALASVAPSNASGFKVTTPGVLVTPKLGTSKFVMSLPLWLDISNNGKYIFASLFKNATDVFAGSTFIPGSLAVHYAITADRPAMVNLQCEFTPGNATPFWVFLVMACNDGSVVYINQSKDGDNMGGSGTCLRIDEVAA